eukprot:TRINITY_DN27056_c0_g1_i3.p1 TRINITY_DN27056_c0_g1~~TRINITY_DN27056_c0_g1_i3.p1  ORF type:complete len:159 (-),score=11.35 TRINITY_DN27056_c0_g1_i3:81-557(-)
MARRSDSMLLRMIRKLTVMRGKFQGTIDRRALEGMLSNAKSSSLAVLLAAGRCCRNRIHLDEVLLHLGQSGVERPLFFRRDAHHALFVDDQRNGLQLVEQRASLLRHQHALGPAVFLVGHAFDEPVLLESIDQPAERHLAHIEKPRKFDLRIAFVVVA